MRGTLPEVPELLCEQLSPAKHPRLDGADRDTERLGGSLQGQTFEVDENDRGSKLGLECYEGLFD